METGAFALLHLLHKLQLQHIGHTLMPLLRALLSQSIKEEHAEAGAGGGGMENGAFALPHLLHKYANVYNCNGRIGIYTAQEREAIIARFKAKRLRRVWRKKVRRRSASAADHLRLR